MEEIPGKNTTTNKFNYTGALVDEDALRKAKEDEQAKAWKNNYAEDYLKASKNTIRITPEYAKASMLVSDEMAKAASIGGDSINHPFHYNNHPSGVECIQITEHFNFNLGNAIKYIWRAGSKYSYIEDLKKAAWYVNREIERIQNEVGKVR